MRFITKLALLTIFISSVTYAQTNGETNVTGQINALIIFRHAQDLDDDKWQKDCSTQLTADEAKKYGITCDKEKWKYSFRDPEAKPVLIPWRRLVYKDDTKDKDGNILKNGITQAQKIADKLPGWLYQHGYSPVNRVITKDPRPYDHTTTNPFQTVAPLVLTLDKDERNYLPGRDFVRLKFLMNMSDNELIQPALFNGTEFSSVLCWDAEGLWGKVDGEYPATMTSDSIFSRLLTQQSIDDVNNLGKPHKAKEIYILVYDKELQKFTVDYVLDLDDMSLIYDGRGR